MFENESLKIINQSLGDIDIYEKEYLEQTISYISIYNNSQYSPEETLKSNDTIIMYNIMNIIDEMKQLIFTFNSINYRSVPSSQEKLEKSLHLDHARKTISIVHVPSGIVRALTYLKDDAKLINEGMRLKQVELALIEDGKHTIRVYKKDNIIMILTTNYSWNLLRKIISLTPLIHDIEFKEEEVSDIFKYYGALDFNNWVTAVNKWYKKHNFRAKAMENKLNTMFRKQADKQTNVIKDKISTIQCKINDYENILAEHYRELSNNKALLRGLLIDPQDDTAIKDNIAYLINNKVLKVIQVYQNNGKITLQVNAPAKYYDNKYLKKYLQKGTVLRYDSTKRLLKEIYIDNIYELIFATKFTISLNSCYVQATDTDNTNLGGYPHPHIMRFDCWGDNKTHIYKAISKHDIIGALEQCIAACYNLNFADTTVVSTLENKLRYNYKIIKCIKDKEGNLFTPLEIFNKYIEEEGEQENEVYSVTEN